MIISKGKFFANHIDIVFYLRSIGYKKTIFYKEHPSSWNYRINVVGPTRVAQTRSMSYYEHLLDMGCIFLDKNETYIFKHFDIRPSTILFKLDKKKCFEELNNKFTLIRDPK